MKGKTVLLLALLLMIVCIGGRDTYAESKKILYVNSYHKGYPPSDGMEYGVEATIGRTGHDLKIIRMDSKRHSSESYKINKGMQIKRVIEDYNPDVVILTDDNAIKYVFVPHFTNKDLPFVFSGVNWDLSQYGGPYSNLTGMIEVALIDQIIKHLRPYARGNRVGYLSGNNYSERQTAKYAQDYFGIRFSKQYFVSSFEEWKQVWIQAQEDVDILIFENNAGIAGWQDSKAIGFIMANTNIMVGATNDFMARFSLIGITRDAEEQGVYPAMIALQILEGKKADNFPITRNKKAKICLNMKLAKKMGIVFPMELIEDAVFVEESMLKE